MTKKSGRKRRRGNGSLYVTVIVALMLLAAITGVSVFFKISDIVVEGINAYTAEQVIAASGIELDESIFFLRESSAAVKIKDTLAYVDEVRIVRSLPGTVRIIITESYPIASIKYEGSFLIIDENAKILEKTAVNKTNSAIPVYGVTPLMPVVGETLSLGDSGSVQLLYLKQVLSGLLSYGIYNDIEWLDMTNISAVTFYYQNKYTVNLGKGENLEDKLYYLQQITEAHKDDDFSATIDLSDDGFGRYIKD